MNATDISVLLAEHSTVIVAGAGGVGKTTIAAALGRLASQNDGGRVLVLTVDPARRLSTAMGLDDVGGVPRRVPGDHPGELWIEMFDARAEWDRLITTHAPDPATRDAVLGNSLYQSVAKRFIHSHEYVAMERLHRLQASGEWDLIVLDTPPSRNALDLLDAPARMRDFFGGRLLRWLTVPASSRIAMGATRPFRMIADRILGGPFVSDLAEFFVLMKTMEKGFVARALEVEESLSDSSTSFVVVTTPEVGPVGEAGRLVDELAVRGCHTGAVIANRCTPRADDAEVSGISDLVGAAAPDTPPDLSARVVRAMQRTVDQTRSVVSAEDMILESLPVDVPAFRVATLDSDVADLSGVEQVSRLLAAATPVVA